MKQRNYWTREKCKEEALKYDTRKDFQICCVTAYNKSRKKGWLDEFLLTYEEN